MARFEDIASMEYADGKRVTVQMEKTDEPSVEISSGEEFAAAEALPRNLYRVCVQGRAIIYFNTYEEAMNFALEKTHRGKKPPAATGI